MKQFIQVPWICIITITSYLLKYGECGYGFTYSTFTGPVSGPSEEIVMPVYHDESNDDPNSVPPKRVDYVAKPDYTFSYGIEDPNTGNSQAHYESRDGDVVQGQYSLIEPDGSLRKVTYTADPIHGFQAKVEFIPPADTSDGSAAVTSSPDYQNQQQENDYSQLNTPNSDYNGGNFDYISTPTFESTEQPLSSAGYNTFNQESHDSGGGVGSVGSVGSIGSDDDDKEFPIPSGPDFEEISNMFTSSGGLSDFTGASKIGDFKSISEPFENLANDHESLFEKLPPFPPLPDLNINDFSNTNEYDELDGEK